LKKDIFLIMMEHLSVLMNVAPVERSPLMTEIVPLAVEHLLAVAMHSNGWAV
jgi:hypothetical protein